MKSISARDVLKALPHYKNEFDVISKDNDAEVYGVLDAVGFDSRRGVVYEVALHRDMSGKVAVGYRLCGEFNPDPKYRQFHDLTERIAINGLTDPTFARELEEIRGKRFDYNNKEEIEVKDNTHGKHRYYSEEELKDMGYTGGEEEDDYDGPVSDNYETITQQIETMKTLLKIARGAE